MWVFHYERELFIVGFYNKYKLQHSNCIKNCNFFRLKTKKNQNLFKQYVNALVINSSTRIASIED